MMREAQETIERQKEIPHMREMAPYQRCPGFFEAQSSGRQQVV